MDINELPTMVDVQETAIEPVASSVNLSEESKALIVHDTGAHGFSMGYNYNGKLRSAEILLKEDGSFQLIRRAETPADYFATFDFSPFNL